jgi:hypothetical protein
VRSLMVEFVEEAVELALLGGSKWRRARSSAVDGNLGAFMRCLSPMDRSVFPKRSLPARASRALLMSRCLTIATRRGGVS